STPRKVRSTGTAADDDFASIAEEENALAGGHDLGDEMDLVRPGRRAPAANGRASDSPSNGSPEGVPSAHAGGATTTTTETETETETDDDSDGDSGSGDRGPGQQWRDDDASANKRRRRRRGRDRERGPGDGRPERDVSRP